MSNNPRIQIVREHLNLKKNNENPSLKDQMKALERTRYGRLRAKQKVVDGICSTHSPDKLLKQMSFGFKIKFKRKYRGGTTSEYIFESDEDQMGVHSKNLKEPHGPCDIGLHSK